MNIIERLQEWLDALTRRPAVQRLLVRLGINPRHYLVLRDLFVTLGQRGQITDQLGMESGALTIISGLYAVIAAGVALIAALMNAQPDTYLFGFLASSTVILLSVLLSEAGNSLVNPVEGLVLAHQPITGATYTAAKLTHLLIIVVSIVVAMNGIPAVLGLMLPTTTAWYPLARPSASASPSAAACSTSCGAAAGATTSPTSTPRCARPTYPRTPALPWASAAASNRAACPKPFRLKTGAGSLL